MSPRGGDSDRTDTPPLPPGGPLRPERHDEAGARGAVGGDIIGLLALALQFGGAALAGVSATHETAKAVAAPGVLLALALDGQRGRAALVDLFATVLKSTGTSLALGADAYELRLAVERLVLADDGFLTDPLTTAPLKDGEGVRVTRQVTLRVSANASIEGVTVQAGTTVVVEYLENGLVRVTVRGKFAAGVEVASNAAGLANVTIGPQADITWLLKDGRDASRLLVLLCLGGGGAPAVLGVVTPVPLPQQVTVGMQQSVQVDLGPGGVPVLKGARDITGQMSLDAETGDRHYAFSFSGSASSSFVGPVLDALEAQGRLPGAATFPGANLAEAGVSASLSVDTDPNNRIKSISVRLEGSIGQGLGADTPVGGASATSGKRLVVTVDLSRPELEAMGADGKRVLDALDRGRPDEAFRVLTRLGDELARKASVDQYAYTSVDGKIEMKEGGLSTGGGATVGASVGTYEKSFTSPGR